MMPNTQEVGNNSAKAENKNGNGHAPEGQQDILCDLCGKKDRLTLEQIQQFNGTCSRCYKKKFLEAHKENPVPCVGCEEEFEPSLLTDSLCAACAAPPLSETNPNSIIYSAGNGPQGHATMQYNLTGHLASSVVPEPITWIWEQKFPAGKLALLNGPQGSGKSFLFIDFIAHVTTGSDWPDGAKNTMGPRKVLLASTEDDEGDTIVPRLLAAGANLSLITILGKVEVLQLIRNVGGNVCQTVNKGKFLLDLATHTKLLKGLLKKNPDVALILLDPITAFLGVDETKDKETRPVLESIVEALEGTKATLIGIIHSNKMTKGSAGDKVKGGSSMLGVPRTAWAVGREADDREQRYMALIKGNVLKKESGLSFTIQNKVVDAGKGIEAGYVVWGNEIEDNANDKLQAARKENKDALDKKGEIFKVIVQEALANGPKRSKEEIYPLGKQRGIGDRTMKEAIKSLGVHHNKRGPWYMSLPPNCGPGCNDCGSLRPEDPRIPNPEVI
ncbi:MAG: AAA family ATPase [Candidatus Sulfotelmatobacter sp.]